MLILDDHHHTDHTDDRDLREESAGGPALEVEDLTKVYAGGKTAVAGVSFSVPRGEIFGFLGPNGSGKTTTVRILVTLLRQSSGLARVGGFDTCREASDVRRVIGYAGQSVGVDDDLTTQENLVFAGILHGLGHDECGRRSEELLELFSLTDVAGVRAGQLSGGMRRRVDLAQALVHRPAVLFLDEPTTGLDPQSRNALWALLRELAGRGTTVFLTTQYLEEADRACDRVAIIDNGRLVTIGTPRALKEEVGGGRLLLRLGDHSESAAATLEALRGLPEVTRAESSESAGPDDPLVVYVEDPETAVVTVLRELERRGIGVVGVEPFQASLDDVFLHYTGERPRAEARMVGKVSGMFNAVHGKRREH
jgi:ABC-2 type transport system ATP-binding protein